jgi:hypothetical protein
MAGLQLVRDELLDLAVERAEGRYRRRARAARGGKERFGKHGGHARIAAQAGRLRPASDD